MPACITFAVQELQNESRTDCPKLLECDPSADRKVPELPDRDPREPRIRLVLRLSRTTSLPHQQGTPTDYVWND